MTDTAIVPMSWVILFKLSISTRPQKRSTVALSRTALMLRGEQLHPTC